MYRTLLQQANYIYIYNVLLTVHLSIVLYIYKWQYVAIHV